MSGELIDQMVAEVVGIPIVRSLMEAAREGHSCIKARAEGACSLKGDEEWFDGCIGQWDDLLYLQRCWVLESRAVRALKRLIVDVKQIYIGGKGGDLTQSQFEAVKKGMASSLFCLSGGPGTGKTHVIAKLVSQYKGKDVMIAAPTGKAAMQIKERVNIEQVSTLHRLLDVKSFSDAVWKRDLIDAGLILIDECSMVDLSLWASLLSRVKVGTRLVLVGDPDQLPPIGVGTFYKEICQWIDPKNRAHLEKCMRSSQLDILALADQVKRGEPIRAKPLEEIEISVWAARFQQGDFRILSCKRRGSYGTEAINRAMQDFFEKRGERTIPIMATESKDEYGISNGELGRLIKGKSSQNSQDVVCFKGLELPIALSPAFEVAYAISVHKSQGSEYNHVALVVPPGSEIFGREVLYTGITRARLSLEIYGQPKTVEMCSLKSCERLSGTLRKLECLSP